MSDPSVRAVVADLLPPLLVRLLGRLRRAVSAPDRAAAWQRVSGGPLAGRELLLPAGRQRWQREMLDGSYDDAILGYAAGRGLRGATVVDAGAHIGYHALAFAIMVGDGGVVHAFEPNPHNAGRLRKNLARNADLAPRIRVWDAALADRDGQVELLLTRDVDSGASSGSFIASAHTYHLRSPAYLASFERVAVRGLTLDTLAAESGKEFRPAFLKIDVEGAEGAVLAGAASTLALCRPAIAAEVHSIRAMFETAAQLGQHGYRPRLLREEPDGRCMVAAE